MRINWQNLLARTLWFVVFLCGNSHKNRYDLELKLVLLTRTGGGTTLYAALRGEDLKKREWQDFHPAYFFEFSDLNFIYLFLAARVLWAATSLAMGTL